LADDPERLAAPSDVRMAAAPRGTISRALHAIVEAVRAVPYHSSASGPVILSQVG
jgi:hypothetical protein